MDELFSVRFLLFRMGAGDAFCIGVGCCCCGGDGGEPAGGDDEGDVRIVRTPRVISVIVSGG